ncbi:HNH endonuclease [Bacillus sp. FSL R12-0069]|uniref:HNH endonuclease n=1 Tax=Bacillus sp. FSL R12-0069 TaxID=2975342 RepID=UPI0030F9A666
MILIDDDGNKAKKSSGNKNTGKKNNTGNKSKAKQPTIRNGHLAGKKHPVSGIPFDKKGFPIFRSKFNMTLPRSLWGASNPTQFKYLNRELAKQLVNSKQKIFFASDIKRMQKGDNPVGHTWHHHQTPGLMQLVNTVVHRQTGHTGGRALWGK